MKKVILSLSVILALALTSCKSEANQNTDITPRKQSNEVAMTEISFGVRGNCGMCKNTIEKAAENIEGVGSAYWDVEKKKIDITMDNSKTSEMAIHKAIAASGYDTEKLSGDLEAYDELPGCCKYDHDMTMNQSN